MCMLLYAFCIYFEAFEACLVFFEEFERILFMLSCICLFTFVKRVMELMGGCLLYITNVMESTYSEYLPYVKSFGL